MGTSRRIISLGGPRLPRQIYSERADVAEIVPKGDIFTFRLTAIEGGKLS